MTQSEYITKLEEILINCYHAGGFMQRGKTIHSGTVKDFTAAIQQLNEEAIDTNTHQVSQGNSYAEYVELEELKQVIGSQALERIKEDIK